MLLLLVIVVVVVIVFDSVAVVVVGGLLHWLGLCLGPKSLRFVRLFQIIIYYYYATVCSLPSLCLCLSVFKSVSFSLLN